MIKENMKHLFAVIALLWQSATCAHDMVQDYKVVAVLDGGTMRVAGAETELTCQLYGIVAPDKRLVVGQLSRESMVELAYRKDVHVHVINTVGKSILGCRVYVGGKDISREQVRRGMAWAFGGNTIDAELQYAKDMARRRGLGLWSEPDLVPPAQ